MIRVPMLTVGMPVYNPNHHFRSAISSLLNQSFKDWELIIIDDGSQNNIYEFIWDLIDPRFIILRDGVNKGLASRLNECIEIARGKYFARMDADDISYPDRFEKQITYLIRTRDIDLIASRALVIGQDNCPKGTLPFRETHDDLIRNPWIGIYMPHPTWMGKTDWFRKYLYKTPAPHFCEDQELLLRAHKGSRYETLNEILLAYRARDLIDEKKLLKTRRAILDFQLRFYWVSGCYVHCGLCFCSYLAKRCSDFYRMLITRKDSFRFQPPSEAELLQWQSIALSFPSKS